MFITYLSSKILNITKRMKTQRLQVDLILKVKAKKFLKETNTKITLEFFS